MTMNSGVSHTAELPYVWGTPILYQQNQAVVDDSGGIVKTTLWTQVEINYSDYIMLLWTNFAKYGLVFGVTVILQRILNNRI